MNLLEDAVRPFRGAPVLVRSWVHFRPCELHAGFLPCFIARARALLVRALAIVCRLTAPHARTASALALAHPLLVLRRLEVRDIAASLHFAGEV